MYLAYESSHELENIPIKESMTQPLNVTWKKDPLNGHGKPINRYSNLNLFSYRSKASIRDNLNLMSPRFGVEEGVSSNY